LLLTAYRSPFTVHSLTTHVRAKKSCQARFSRLHKIQRKLKPIDEQPKPSQAIQRNKAHPYDIGCLASPTTRKPNSHLPTVFPSLP
jgi:hypothetical protein